MTMKRHSVLDAEGDPDDLYPESDVTKQFWKNLFEEIEQRRHESEYQ